MFYLYVCTFFSIVLFSHFTSQSVFDIFVFIYGCHTPSLDHCALYSTTVLVLIEMSSGNEECNENKRTHSHRRLHLPIEWSFSIYEWHVYRKYSIEMAMPNYWYTKLLDRNRNPINNSCTDEHRIQHLKFNNHKWSQCTPILIELNGSSKSL